MNPIQRRVRSLEARTHTPPVRSRYPAGPLHWLDTADPADVAALLASCNFRTLRDLIAERAGAEGCTREAART